MTTSAARTLIVIPAYNEEASIASVLREIEQVGPDADCIVVDDGSADATRAVARAAGATVLSLPCNLGVGGALRLGYRYALENGYANVVQIDADGQHDPAELPKLLAALSDSDLVIGARFAGEGEYTTRGPRRWAMWILARVISRVASTPLTDTTSGFKAAGPRAVRLFAADYPAEYLGDTVEALVIAARSGCRITQVPVHMRPRLNGTPSQNALRSTGFLARVCLALTFAIVRPRRTLPHPEALA